MTTPAFQHSKLDFDNPTPADVRAVDIGNAQYLAKLQRLKVWSPDQFWQVVYCHIRYRADCKKWVVNLDAMRDLAFDARAPDGEIKLLLQFVKRAEKDLPNPANALS